MKGGEYYGDIVISYGKFDFSLVSWSHCALYRKIYEHKIQKQVKDKTVVAPTVFFVFDSMENLVISYFLGLNQELF